MTSVFGLSFCYHFGHSRSIWSTYLWNGWHPAWLQMEETPLRPFWWKNLRKNTAFADCTVSVSFPLHRGMKITNLEKKPGISWGLHRIYPSTSLHPLISCLMELTFCSGFSRLFWRPDARELPGEARFTRKNFWISDWLAVLAGQLGEMRNNPTTWFFDATNTHWFHLISWFFAIAILLRSVGRFMFWNTQICTHYRQLLVTISLSFVMYTHRIIVDEPWIWMLKNCHICSKESPFCNHTFQL